MVLPDTIRIYFVAGLVESLLALVLNVILLVCNAPFLHKLSPSSFLIFWLGFCDGGIITFNVYLVLCQIRADSTEFDPTQCQWIGALGTLLALAGLGCVSGLTFFRYLVVVKQWNLSTRFAPMYILCVFFMSGLIVSVPYLFGFASDSYGSGPSHILCTVSWSDAHIHTKIMAWLCVTILSVPLLFMGYAYGSIYLAVRKSVQQMELNKVRVSVVYQSVSRTHSETSQKHVTGVIQEFGTVGRRKEKDKSDALLAQSLVMVAIFVVGWTPFMCKALYQIITNITVSADIDFVTDAIVVLMQLLNPVVVMFYDVEMGGNVARAFHSIRILAWRHESAVFYHK